MKKMTAVATALILVAALAVTTGCTRVRLQDSKTTKTFTESNSVPLQGATSLAAVIHQGVGELTIHGSEDATGAVQTTFTFSPENWRPEVTSSVEGTAASLRIEQPSNSDATMFTDVRNSWLVSLPHGVATDLTLELGVGKSDVDLRGVDLTNLDVSTGVGETTIDLSGPRTSDLGARVEAGVGTLTMRLPRNVGVRVSGREKGVGKFSADGFTSQGDTWVNSAYAGSGPKIEIDLTRGVGDVILQLVD